MLDCSCTSHKLVWKLSLCKHSTATLQGQYCCLSLKLKTFQSFWMWSGWAEQKLSCNWVEGTWSHNNLILSSWCSWRWLRWIQNRLKHLANRGKFSDEWVIDSHMLYSHIQTLNQRRQLSWCQTQFTSWNCNHLSFSRVCRHSIQTNRLCRVCHTLWHRDTHLYLDVGV